MTAFFTADAALFHTALSRVALATTNDAALPELNCIACLISGEKLHMWATDRYRLHYEVIELENSDMADDKVFYIPANIAKDLKSLDWNKRKAGMATVHFDEHMVSFSADDSRNMTIRSEGYFSALLSVLRLMKEALEGVTNNERVTPSFSVLNGKFLTDVEKAGRMNPYHKAKGLVIEHVPGNGGKVLVQFAGINADFRALIMGTLLGADKVCEPVKNQDILDALPELNR